MAKVIWEGWITADDFRRGHVPASPTGPLVKRDGKKIIALTMSPKQTRLLDLLTRPKMAEGG